jgi:Asp-tRNA(Asn)/Glu-tRNA(Gln) amidotransferase A subunit family amidase
MTGQPSIVIPNASDSPPLGAQLIGRPYRDNDLLDIAQTVEENAPKWHD